MVENESLKPNVLAVHSHFLVKNILLQGYGDSNVQNQV